MLKEAINFRALISQLGQQINMIKITIDFGNTHLTKMDDKIPTNIYTLKSKFKCSLAFGFVDKYIISRLGTPE